MPVLTCRRLGSGKVAAAAADDVPQSQSVPACIRSSLTGSGASHQTLRGSQRVNGRRLMSVNETRRTAAGSAR